MNTINAIMTTACDCILSPFAAWPPLLTLVMVSAIAGVLMAVVFRFTSRQRALKRVVELCRAQLLAIKLYKDDPVVMFFSLGRLLKYTGLRLWHSLPPAIVMIVPFVLLLAQLARWYEYYPLVPGEKAVVELQVAEDAWPDYRNATLETPEQVVVEIGPLRDDQEHAVYWRIRANGEAPARIRCLRQSEEFDKHVALAAQKEPLCAVSVRRPGASWWDRVTHPGEPGFASASPVRGFTIHYARRSTPILGRDVPWWLTFVLVSMLAAVLARPLVKVQF